MELTDEQIATLKQVALAATPQDIDSAQDIDRFPDGSRYCTCPACDGEGHVDLEADYCNYDGHALGVQFYGIGKEPGDAEAYFRALKPATVLALIDRLERAEAALLSASKPAAAEGWKLVPVEPTDAMTYVGQKHRYEPVWSIGAIYREMLAASPAAPAQSSQPATLEPNTVKAGSDILGAQPAMAAPAGSGGAVATVYVGCHQCIECGHVGINDSHPTDASCGYPCGWTGPSPVEDKCPGCQREGVMGLSCPKCSGRYAILAEARIPVSAPQSSTVAPAQSEESIYQVRDDVRTWIDVDEDMFERSQQEERRIVYAARQPSLPAKAGEARCIYVASRASIPDRPDMWKGLRLTGWPIVSTWIDESGEGETDDFSELWTRIEREIRSSAGVLLYAEADDFPLKGALIECGIALGMGKPVAVVLPNVSLHPRSAKPIGSWVKHPLVTIYSTLVEARDALLGGTQTAVVLDGERAMFQAALRVRVEANERTDITSFEAGWFARAASPQSPKGDERAQVGTDRTPPFSNCRFKECDLPGQCAGEGKCHHPAVAAAAPQAGAGLTDAQIDKIADAVIRPVAGERISYWQAREFARAIIAAHPTGKAEDAQAAGDDK